MASRPPSATGQVSYEALKAWIAAQEAYERQHGRPAPLTDEHRHAMAVLVPPPPVQEQEAAPDGLSDVDWVSLLMRYTQTYKGEQKPPVYSDEEQVLYKLSSSPLWRIRCQLPREAPDRWFPDLDEVPRDSLSCVFATKKDAKKYAARCAAKWLMSQNLLPSDGKSVTFSGRSRPLGPPKTRSVEELIGIKRPAGSPPSVPAVDSSDEQTTRLTHLSNRVQATGPQQTEDQSEPSQPQPAKRPRLEKADKERPPPVSAKPVLAPVSAAFQPAEPLEQPVNGTPMVSPQIHSMATWRPKAGSAGKASPVVAAAVAAAAAAASATATGGVGSNSPSPGLSTEANGTNKPLPTPKGEKNPNGNGKSYDKNDRSLWFRGSNGGGHDDYDDVPNTRRLDELCKILKIGTPFYDFKAVEGGAGGIFSGRIVLPSSPGGGKADGAKTVVLPEGVGVVHNLYTKRAAREKAAQSVLRYLQETMPRPEWTV